MNIEDFRDQCFGTRPRISRGLLCTIIVAFTIMVSIAICTALVARMVRLELRITKLEQAK